MAKKTGLELTDTRPHVDGGHEAVVAQAAVLPGDVGALASVADVGSFLTLVDVWHKRQTHTVTRCCVRRVCSGGQSEYSQYSDRHKKRTHTFQWWKEVFGHLPLPTSILALCTCTAKNWMLSKTMPDTQVKEVN